jgi:hypothetical protein
VKVKYTHYSIYLIYLLLTLATTLFSFGAGLLASLVGLLWFQRESGSSILGQCGSRPGSRILMTIDCKISQLIGIFFLYHELRLRPPKRMSKQQEEPPALQHSKENIKHQIQHFKHEISSFFLYCGPLCPLGSGSGSSRRKA